MWRIGWSLMALFSIAAPARAQIITTVAGESTWGRVSDVAVDAAGNIYVSDAARDVVYRVDRLGAASVVAGTGTGGYTGDGGLAVNARISNPIAVALDGAGSLYIADSGNHRIRRVDSRGIITTIAGTAQRGFSGDGGPAVEARIQAPLDVAVDTAGNVFFSDAGNARIRRIDRSGVITTVAGFGTRGFSGDGGRAILAQIDPGAIAFGPDGSIFFTDDGNSTPSGNGRVRRIGPDGTISTVAGDGSSRYSGDGGPATSAGFASLDGVAVDSQGNLYISEYWGNRVRKVAATGIITTYAGTGAGGFSGDGGEAINATLYAPLGLAVDRAGNLYVADASNRRVRKIAPPAAPTISSTNAAVPSFMGRTGFSSNMYLEIYGANLAQTTRTWSGSDFDSSRAPTSLDGVSVTVNGIPAFVYYVCPGQININTPEDSATGPVQIQVKNAVGESNAGTVMRARLSPALHTAPQFATGGKQHVVAQTPDFRSFIGHPGMVRGLSFTPARPGDTVAIYALGCGPTEPPARAGIVTAAAGRLTMPYEVRIGGVPADVTFAGAVPNAIGLYQFNIVIPGVLAADQPIELIVDGVRNAQDLVIAVGQ